MPPKQVFILSVNAVLAVSIEQLNMLSCVLPMKYLRLSREGNTKKRKLKYHKEGKLPVESEGCKN